MTFRNRSWQRNNKQSGRFSRRHLGVEPLEARRLLAASSSQNGPGLGGGFTPDQIRQVYGFNQIAGLPSNDYDLAGQGQTIAIINWHEDPAISHDLQQFDEFFNIAGAANDPTSLGFFKVVNQDGGKPSTMPGLATSNEAGVQALDVEWAHAIAPGANILLVEADSNSTSELDTAVRYAASQPTVSVVSMGFSGYLGQANELSSDPTRNGVFTSPAGHQGVSFVAASGDKGAPPGFPGSSPNVLAVGGTTLPLDKSGNPDLSSESAWSGSGGGLSQYQIEPSYQVGVVPTALDPSTGSATTPVRAVPDVAYDADPNTGFAVYNSYSAPAASPWIKVGGTGAGTVQWAALIAIADQERAALADGTLDGPSQLLPALYQISGTDGGAFNDITTGASTGSPKYSAAPGYDLVTGLGTPNAQNIVSDLLNVFNGPPLSNTVYWTGDAGSTGTDSNGNKLYNWDDPANWSQFDPKVNNIPGNMLPGPNDNVVIDLDNQSIYKGPTTQGTSVVNNINTYDKISSMTVTGKNVTIQINAGTLDLSGGGKAGTLQVDQTGDKFFLGGTLVSPSVTSGTTVAAVVGSTGIIEGGTFAGTLKAPAGSTLRLEESWKNSGTITADAGSTLVLGDTWSAGESDKAAKSDAWTNTGTITTTQATVELGGWLSFNSTANNLTTLNLSTDTVSLIGTVDNANGLITLAPGVSSASGNWDLYNGRIDQGAIAATGGAALADSGFGTLDGVTINVGVSINVSDGGSLTFEGLGWTNNGTINANPGATLNLYGSWINQGNITVAVNSNTGSSTTVNLGAPIDIDPTSAAAANDTWTNNGAIAVAIGPGVTAPIAGLVTLNLGGVFTTATYNGLINGLNSTTQTLPTINLTGTLDNSAADNPVNQDVLALTDSTGPLNLSGGRIYQGTITTLGANTLVATAPDTDSRPQSGTLDGVTLDGTLDMTTVAGAYVYVINGLTVNGTIKLGGAAGSANNAVAYFGKGGTSDQTIAGTGTIVFGQDTAGDSLDNLSSGFLTFGPQLTVQGGLTGTIASSFVELQGTLQETTSGGKLALGGDVINHGVVTVATKASMSAGTYDQEAGTTTVAEELDASGVDMNGGAVVVASGGTINLGTGDYSQQGGTTTVDGTIAAAHFYLFGGKLDGTGTIKAEVVNGGTTKGATLYPGDDPGTLTIQGDYTQTSSGTLDIEIGGPNLFSQLAVSGTATLAGTLDVSLINGFVPSTGETFPFLTFGQLVGKFDTVVGVTIGANEVLVPTFTSSGVTLTATPVTIYWTGDAGDNDWANSGNWSYTDPLSAGGKGPDGALPGAYSKVIVDLANLSINHAANDDVITSLTVSGQNVTLNLTGGTLDLSGGGGRGTFQADQPGDAVNLENHIVLRDADVTSGTTLTATTVVSVTFNGDFNGTLDGVQLDGNLVTQVSNQTNLTDIAPNIYLAVINGLVLNGTIELGPAADTSYPEQDWIYFGNQGDNVAQTISGTGTIRLSPSTDSAGNNGTNSQSLFNESNATLTIGPQITIDAGSNTQISGGPFDNQGTIEANTKDGQLNILVVGLTNDGTIDLSNGTTASVQGFSTNNGTIAVSGGASARLEGSYVSTVNADVGPWTNSASGRLTAAGGTLDLEGRWTNDGAITVDATSTVELGTQTAFQYFDLVSSYYANYIWTNSGTLSIADGANVVLGGIFTTDFLNAFRAGLLANGEHLVNDTVYLAATLDNRPQDNPVSGGVLALDASTGPLYLLGGLVAQGTVTTNGSDDLVATGSNFTVGGVAIGGAATLDGIELDGTLDMSQYADVRVIVYDNFTLNGTVKLGGVAGTSNFAALNVENPPNTNGSIPPETLRGTGTIEFGQDKQGDALGGLAGALTLGPNLTVQAGWNSLIQFNGLDNQGTIKEDTPGGQLTIAAYQWTNDGLIEVSNGAAATLEDERGNGTNSSTGRITASSATFNLGNNYGPLTNDGAISVDDATLNLQSPLNTTLSDPQVQYIRWSSPGTITASGASTVNMGGVFTSDSLKGLVVNNPSLANAALNLTGTLDNIPADNPVNAGNLVLNASTGPLNLAGGRIIQGTITTTGGDDLVATAADQSYFTQDVVNTNLVIPFGHGGGVLDGVTLDGTLDMTQFVYANVNVINGLTLNGTIELGGAAGTDHFAYLYFGMGLELNDASDSRPDTTPETISGTGTIVFGQDNVAPTPVSTTVPAFIDGDAIYDTISAKLTIGPKITIKGGSASYILADGVSNANGIENQGTIVENTSGGLTLAMPNGFANAGSVTLGSGGTLATVALIYGPPGSITVGSASDYTQSAGTTTVDGTLTAKNLDLNGGTLNGTGTIKANVTNAATVYPGDDPGTLTIRGNYTQTSFGTLNIDIAGATQFSQLAVSGTATLDGMLNVTLIGGFVPAAGDSFKVLTFASHSGNFATTNGLSLPGGGALVPAFNPTDLTLTATGQQLGTVVMVQSDHASGSVYGQSVTFTATVSAATSSTNTPAGTVQFQVDGANLGNPVNLSGGSATISTASLPAGNHAVTALYSGNDQFQAESGTLTGGQTVTPAPLTISADNKSMVAGGSLPELTASYSGFVNGDTSASLQTPPVLSTTATSASPPGNYPISVSGAVDPNYNITYVPGTLSVMPAPLLASVVTVGSDKSSGSIYGQTVTFTATVTAASSDNSPAGSVQFQIDGANFGNPVDLSGGSASINTASLPAGNHVITALYSGNDQFQANNGTLPGGQTVMPAPLTITADDKSMVYGGALPALTVSYSGLVNGDTPATFAASPNTTPSVATVAATSQAGNYAITVSAASDPNYNILFAAGTLTIAPAPLTITADNKSMVAGGPLPMLTANYTGLVNGDTSASLPMPPVLSTTATSASPRGNYPISVSGAVDPNYNINYVPGTLTVYSAVTGGIAATAVAVTGNEYSLLTGVTVATFTDGDGTLPASDFSATINWGDGSTSAASVSLSATGAGGTPAPQYAVSGTHTYHDEGHFTAQVSINQSPGAPTSGATSATVSAAVTMHEQLLAEGTEGSPNQKYIQEIYRDLFNRQAEPQGREGWVEQLTEGAPRGAVAYEIVKLASPEEFPHDTVSALYQQYLGRAPDSTGDQFWTAYLYSPSGTIEGMAEALVGSREYFQVRGGGTADGFLQALFHDALSREIDAGATTYFTRLLAQGRSTYEIATMIFLSGEYQRDRVNALYEQLLDRPADPAGLAFFAAEFAHGMTDESVIAQILSSDEYFAKSQT